MAQLAADAVKAGIDFSVDDNTAANAGTQSDHDHIADALGSACDGFSVSRHIGVVFQINRLVNPLFYISKGVFSNCKLQE